MTTAVEHAAVRRSGRTRARAPPAPARAGLRSRMYRCILWLCARMCVCLRPGPAVTSSGGASRAPGTPSYLVGFARCYLLRELVVG